MSNVVLLLVNYFGPLSSRRDCNTNIDSAEMTKALLDYNFF